MQTDQAEPAAPPTPITGAPLVDRLFTKHGMPFLTETDLDAFITGEGLRVVFVTGDPVKLLDSVDIAVILPELCRVFSGRLSGGVLDRKAETLVAQRYGADVRPALVFFSGGTHRGTITRVRDWEEYTARITQFLDEGAAAPRPTVQ